MRTCKGTTPRSLSLAAMTALCTTGFASVALGEVVGDAPDSFRLPANEIGSVEGGIAGVSFQEAFESGFVYGFGCGQNGWTCPAAIPPATPAGDFEIIDAPDPAFLLYTAQDQAAGHGAGLQEIRSPLFALETGPISER